MGPKKDNLLWKPEDLKKFKNFIILHRGSFVTHFYRNLLNPATQVRREPRLFIKMHKFVSKSIKQCKSKFQKFEHKVFADYLQIPLDHLRAYQGLKKRKSGILNSGGCLRSSPKFKENDFNRANNTQEKKFLGTNKELKKDKEVRKPFPNIKLSDLKFKKDNPKYKHYFHSQCRCRPGVSLETIRESEEQEPGVSATRISRTEAEASKGDPLFAHKSGTPFDKYVL